MREKQTLKRRNHHKSINTSGLVWTRTPPQSPWGCDRSRAKPSKLTNALEFSLLRHTAGWRLPRVHLLRASLSVVTRELLCSRGFVFALFGIPVCQGQLYIYEISIGLAWLIDNLNHIREANVGRVPATTSQRITLRPISSRREGWALAIVTLKQSPTACMFEVGSEDYCEQDPICRVFPMILSETVDDRCSECCQTVGIYKCFLGPHTNQRQKSERTARNKLGNKNQRRKSSTSAGLHHAILAVASSAYASFVAEKIRDLP